MVRNNRVANDVECPQEILETLAQVCHDSWQHPDDYPPFDYLLDYGGRNVNTDAMFFRPVITPASHDMLE